MGEPIIAGNWKMNTTIEEATELVAKLKPALEAIDGIQKVVCPPFVALVPVYELLRGTSISLGAQDMHHESNGAYTGEVSPAMLAGLCQFVIVGHSERRQMFGETDATVAKKVEAALRAGIRPIMCVGEGLEEREEGKAEAVVERQVRRGLERVESPDGLVVAYEPVWAIGTGKAATPEDAQAMMAHIRSTLRARYGDGAASQVALLYGGSVTADNVGGFARQKDIDGALVGGASLDAGSFAQLVRNAALEFA